MMSCAAHGRRINEAFTINIRARRRRANAVTRVKAALDSPSR
jgi:hypothetical protein